MSFSSGNNKTKQSSTSDPTFNYAGATDLLDSLLSNSQQTTDANDTKIQGLDFLKSLVAGNPFESEMSEPLTNQIQSIINERNNNLGRDLASTRSQFYRGPAGRNLMAVDDAFVRNKLGTDRIISDLIQGQYNQDRALATNSANNLVTTGLTDFNQTLSLLSLLRGSKGTGTSRTSGSGFTLNVPELLGAAGGLMGGGIAPTSGSGVAPA